MAFRDGPFQDLRLPLTWAAVGATLIAILIALGLLLAGRGGDTAAGPFAPARNAFNRAAEPVEAWLETPVEWVGDGVDTVGGYFFAVSENRRLKQQVRDLQGWRDAAIAMRNVNDRYAALLKLKTEPAVPMVSARTVMDSRGPFANARVLDVGADAGVKVGDPVISEHGVVGRIVGVAPGASRMLLLNDVESRTPVLVDRTNARAILTGDGGAYPQLDYVRGRDPIGDGDMILTSGDGGVFPRGLPVGVAAKDLKGQWRAKLYADETPIDYVRVLLYQDFSQAIPPTAFSTSALPPLTPAEAAERASALTPAGAAPSASTTVAAQSSQSATPGAATAAAAARTTHAPTKPKSELLPKARPRSDEARSDEDGYGEPRPYPTRPTPTRDASNTVTGLY